MKTRTLNIPFETLYNRFNIDDPESVQISKIGMEWLCEHYWNEHYVRALSFNANMKEEFISVQYTLN
jgi:hypothetical protein